MTVDELDRVIDLAAAIVLRAVRIKGAAVADDTVTVLFEADDVIEAAGDIQRIAGAHIFPGIVRP